MDDTQDIRVIFKNAGDNFIFANKLDKGDGTPPQDIPAKTIAEKIAAGTYINGTFTRAKNVEAEGNKIKIFMEDSENLSTEIDLTQRGGAKKSRKSKKRIHRKRRRTMNKK
jgi:hypothetical protein